MAVGLKEPGILHPVKGVSLATTAAGIRYQGRDDLLLISRIDVLSNPGPYWRLVYVSSILVCYER